MRMFISVLGNLLAQAAFTGTPVLITIFTYHESWAAISIYIFMCLACNTHTFAILGSLTLSHSSARKDTSREVSGQHHQTRQAT